MRTVLLTQAGVEPVSLDELKAHVQVEHDLDDALLTACQLAARVWVETHLRCALISQTFEGYLDCFPCGPIVLRHGALQSVDSVMYYDADGVEQTLDPSVYHVDTVRRPGRLYLRHGESWPATEFGRPNAVRVQFVAGFGDSPEDVPAPIKAAIKLLAGHMYAFREPEITGTVIARSGFAHEALLAPYRVMGVV